MKQIKTLNRHKICQIIRKEPGLNISDICVRIEHEKSDRGNKPARQVISSLRQKKIIYRLKDYYYPFELIRNICIVLGEEPKTTREITSRYRQMFGFLSLENAQRALIHLKEAKIVALVHGTPDKWVALSIDRILS